MKKKEAHQSLSTRQQLKKLKLLAAAGSKNESFRVRALAFACDLLASKELTLVTFRELFDTIVSLDYHNLRVYRPQLELAYSRLTPAIQKFAIWFMFQYYVELEDWVAAGRCIRVEETDSSYVGDALKVALRLGDQQLLAALRRRAKSMSDVPAPCSMLLAHLAAHYQECGQWEEAIALWQRAMEFMPWSSNAIVGIAQTHASMALAQLALAEKKLDALKAVAAANPELDTPFGGGSWIADAEQELNYFSTQFRNLLELDWDSRRKVTPSTKEQNNEH